MKCRKCLGCFACAVACSHRRPVSTAWCTVSTFSPRVCSPVRFCLTPAMFSNVLRYINNHYHPCTDSIPCCLILYYLFTYFRLVGYIATCTVSTAVSSSCLLCPCVNYLCSCNLPNLVNCRFVCVFPYISVVLLCPFAIVLVLPGKEVSPVHTVLQFCVRPPASGGMLVGVG